MPNDKNTTTHTGYLLVRAVSPKLYACEVNLQNASWRINGHLLQASLFEARVAREVQIMLNADPELPQDWKIQEMALTSVGEPL